MTTGHEHGKSHRRLPLKESHWSYNDFTDMVNRQEHGLKGSRGRKSTWTPDPDMVKKVVAMLGCSEETAITMLRAAHELNK